MNAHVCVDTQDDLQKLIVPSWEEQVKRDLDTTFRIVGMHAGIPILNIPESLTPAVYAVDLARFASLVRYGEEPAFAVEQFDEVRARQLLAQHPKLILNPPPGSGMEAEWIQQLQLRVRLRLYETYELTLKDRVCAAGGSLTGPVLEWHPDYV